MFLLTLKFVILDSTWTSWLWGVVISLLQSVLAFWFSFQYFVRLNWIKSRAYPTQGLLRRLRLRGWLQFKFQLWGNWSIINTGHQYTCTPLSPWNSCSFRAVARFTVSRLIKINQALEIFLMNWKMCLCFRKTHVFAFFSWTENNQERLSGRRDSTSGPADFVVCDVDV